MDYPFSGLGVVEKDPIVVGSRPELNRPAFVVEVICVQMQKRLQPNIL